MLLSFGQLLWMQPWQDDNALFFKLSHIQEPAGFLGRGILGEGPYRYTATPYYLIYVLFGYNIPIYFGLALLAYIIATFAVYYLFSYLISKRAGLLAGFLFAANNTTSDSFVRLFNSVSTSLSVILLSTLIFFKWQQYKTSKSHFILLSLLTYYLITEFAYVRSHYLIGSLLLFDLLFIIKPLGWRNILKLVVYDSLFILVFFWQYILNGDSRTGDGFNIVKDLLSGQIGNLASLFSGVGLLIFPDQFLKFIPTSIGSLTTNPYYTVIILNVIILFLCLIGAAKLGKITKRFGLLTVASLLWFLTSRLIFTHSTSNSHYELFLLEFIGGFLLIFIIYATSFLPTEKAKLILFFLSIVILNIFSYCLYDPSVFFSSYNNRYLVHSYFGLIALLSVFLLTNRKSFIYIVLIWGGANLLLNISSQHQIILARSLPTESFYRQLRQNLPNISKGDMLYFDLEDSSLSHQQFNNAITSSQMPETTAIAWRYGLDRYDFDLFTSFAQVQDALHKDPTRLVRFKSFFFDKGFLSNQTERDLKVLQSGDSVSPKYTTTQRNSDLEIVYPEGIYSHIPFLVNLSLRAEPRDSDSLKFPLGNGSLDVSLIERAIRYRDFYTNFYTTAKISASSHWQDRIEKNLLDQDPNTTWQPDRVIWQKSGGSFVIDLNKPQALNGLIWTNGLRSNTPKHYLIEGSHDGFNWFLLKDVNQSSEIDSGEKQEVSFPATQPKFLRMNIDRTFNNDAPGISEVNVIPVEFNVIERVKIEQFLQQPLANTPSRELYRKVLEDLDSKGEIVVSYKGNKYTEQKTLPGSLEVIMDGLPHTYTFLIPPAGTRVDNIKLTTTNIPGTISVNNLMIEYPSLDKQ